jgi:hypothetical protein
VIDKEVDKHQSPLIWNAQLFTHAFSPALCGRHEPRKFGGTAGIGLSPVKRRPTQERISSVRHRIRKILLQNHPIGYMRVGNTPATLVPRAEQAAHQHQFAQVVGVVVGD